MRLIDADALSRTMYDEAFENDESYNETNPMARWDSGLWIRYKMFEKCLRDAPTIEPNLVINPDEIERGDVVEIGENIVVMHHDDYYDMFLKSELYDDIEPCEDAISRARLKKDLSEWCTNLCNPKTLVSDDVMVVIDNIPSVAPSRPKEESIIEACLLESSTREAYEEGYAKGKEESRPSGEWIPVEWHDITDEEREREGYPKDWIYFLDCEMPDDGQDIIVTTRSGRVFADTCAYDYDYGYSLDCSGYDWGDDIIAWMPLPEPYFVNSPLLFVTTL